LRAGRYQHPLSVLLADLDHFKTVNDTYGHPYGDIVLKEVGKAFFRHCRSSDLCARYGGEEFAILLPETRVEEARLVAERLCAAVRKLKLSHSSGDIQITTSFGVTCVDTTSPQSLEELLEQADHALYEAKHNGRNRVEVYTGPRDIPAPPSSVAGRKA
jgi:diguanylate cyclase (GGDEF)-like protein